MDALDSKRSRVTPFEQEAYSVARLYTEGQDAGDGAHAAYPDALRSARWSILQRFVRGLLRESPDALPDPVVSSRREFANGRLSSESGDALLSQLDADHVGDSVRPLPDSCSAVASFPFPTSDALVVVPVADVHGFDRFRLAPPVTSVTPSSSARITHPNEVIELLEGEAVFPSPEQAAKFRREIDQSVANLALALLAKQTGPLRSSTSGDASALDLTSLEQLAAVQAHPVHPCAKTRLGMDTFDSTQYAAEFTDTVDLRFVAVADENVLEASASDSESVDRTVRDAFPCLETALEGALAPGASPDEYSVFPVHPWQFRNTLPELFDEWGTNLLVPLPEFTYPATPLLSFRTLAPHGNGRNERPPHVKLPVDLLKTSRRRTLPPEDVYNGPMVSELLTSILRAESFESLGFLSEFAGACYAPGGRATATDASEKGEHLSTLLRTNPYDHPLVGDGDRPVTVASLLADSTGEQRPLACSFVEQFADAEGLSGTPDAAYEFVSAYADALVPGLLRLMCKYGIGPEAHLQNTCVVFDADGRPSGTLVRDFGGFRVHTPRLEQQGYSLDAYPDSDIDADRQEMYEMYNALFQTHLGELLVALVRHFDVDEGECWNRVRRASESAFDRLRSDDAVPDDRIDRDESKLLEESAERRALTCMRLFGEEKSIYHSVSNPLATDT